MRIGEIMLSDRDLGSYRGKAVREGRRVQDLMIDSVFMIDQTETIRRAANPMRGRSMLPASDEERANRWNLDAFRSA